MQRHKYIAHQLCFFIFLFAISISHAQWTQEGGNISGWESEGQLGFSSAISGDGNTIIVGIPKSSNFADEGGAARIFQMDNGEWVETGQVVGTGAGCEAGTAVAISLTGNTIAVGAPDYSNGSGWIEVYRDYGSGWSQLGTRINGGSNGDRCGRAVALSADGNTLVVGCPNPSGGSAKIYQFSTSNWDEVAQYSSNQSDDWFGFSASISANGSRVAIGAPRYDGVGADAGQVRSFYLDQNGTWFEGWEVNGFDPGDLMGQSVSLSADGSRIAIGSPVKSGVSLDPGTVHLYENDNEATPSWIPLGATLVGSVGGPGTTGGDSFGIAVGLSGNGNVVVVGAPDNPKTGPNASAGKVQVFKFDGNVNWQPVGQSISGTSGVDRLGTSVGITYDGATIVAGASQFFNGGSELGYAQVFHFDDGHTGGTCSESNDINALFGQAADVPQTSGIWDNTYAQSEDSDPDFGFECFYDIGADGQQSPNLERSLWYSFTGDGSTYRITSVPCNSSNYHSQGDTQMALYSGACNNLSPVLCNDDDPNAFDWRAALEVETVAGETYYLLVDAFSTFEGYTFGEFCLEVTRLATNSTNDLDPSWADIQVMPNPASDHIEINVVNQNLDEVLQLDFYNALGKKMEPTVSIAPYTSHQHLDISHLPNGSYFMQFTNGKNSLTKRVVIHR